MDKLNEIEKVRIELDNSIREYGLNAPETREISEKIDEMINEYYDGIRRYSANSDMYKQYLRSYQELKNVTIFFNEFPTVEGWNQYAKQKRFLCSESLKYIANRDWNELKNKVLIDIKKDESNFSIFKTSKE